MRDLNGSRYAHIGVASSIVEALLWAMHSTHDYAALKARARDFAVDKIADQYLDHLLPGWLKTSVQTEAHG